MLEISASDRLQQQIGFIVEIDKLKSVLRRNYLIDQSRNEDDAQHSWHLAMMTMILAEYADSEVDVLRVLRMVLIHDLVEIDAGDLFLYASGDGQEQQRKEKAAADRIFDLLPKDQSVEMRALWDEFEEGLTPDAAFARSVDRLQPLLLNYHTNGSSWKEHNITVDQPMGLGPKIIARSSDTLADYATNLILRAGESGCFHVPDAVK